METQYQMSDKNLTKLGKLISTTRAAKELRLDDLVDSTSIPRTQLHRIEQGQLGLIQPAALHSLARSLDLPPSDLFSLAGYAIPEELPTFAPYLRSKYRDLPESAKAELERSFRAIAKKHGYDANGPAPGEDEA